MPNNSNTLDSFLVHKAREELRQRHERKLIAETQEAATRHAFHLIFVTLGNRDFVHGLEGGSILRIAMTPSMGNIALHRFFRNTRLTLATLHVVTDEYWTYYSFYPGGFNEKPLIWKDRLPTACLREFMKVIVANARDDELKTIVTRSQE